MDKKIRRKRKVYIMRAALAIVLTVCVLAIVHAGVSAISKRGRGDAVPVVQNEVASQTTLETTTPEPTTAPEEETYSYEQKLVALTFDDGPGPKTMKLLKTLEKYHAKATFFTCGYSLKRDDIDAKAIIQKMDELGCDIGNHTMNHAQLNTLKPKKLKSEIEGVSKIIKSYTGHNPLFVRPPYGAGIRDKTVKKYVGYPMICWNVDPLDWKTKSEKKTIKNVLRDAKDGDIILLHDTHDWTVAAVEKIIPKLQKKGFKLVTVSEMAKARKVKLKKGQAYFDFPQ